MVAQGRCRYPFEEGTMERDLLRAVLDTENTRSAVEKRWRTRWTKWRIVYRSYRRKKVSTNLEAWSEHLPHHRSSAHYTLRHRLQLPTHPPRGGASRVKR